LPSSNEAGGAKGRKKGQKEKGKKENRLLLYSFHCLPHRILGWFSISTLPQRTHHQQTDTLFTARLKHAYIFMTILFTAPNRTASCVTWNWLALLAVAFLFFSFPLPYSGDSPTCPVKQPAFHLVALSLPLL
jgi:hypothetical protein